MRAFHQQRFRNRDSEAAGLRLEFESQFEIMSETMSLPGSLIVSMLMNLKYSAADGGSSAGETLHVLVPAPALVTVGVSLTRESGGAGVF